MQQLDEIVWAVNPKNDSLSDLVNYLCRFAEDFFEGSPTQCVFDLPAEARETEELWFDEWEHGGPYFDQAANYEKWNPVNHVTAWKTPMLFLHGEKDYRCPVSESLMLFEALQARGVPSELMIFPDENHWILKPRNIIAWYDAVGEFLDRHLKP
mgnify:CR=1 FL=1